MQSFTVVKILLCALLSLVFQNPTLAGSLNITLSSAGTLSTRLPSVYYGEVTELKLSGPINGSDINVLKKMSNMTELDLTNAKIVGGGDAYYSYTSKVKFMNGYMTYTYKYYTAETSSLQTKSTGAYSSNTDYYCDDLERAFYENKTLKVIHFPSSANITQIGTYAFFGSNIETLYLDSNIKKLSDKPFIGCNKLKNFIFAKGSMFETKDDGYVYTPAINAVTMKKNYVLSLVPPGYRELVIRDYVCSIDDNALVGNYDTIYIETDNLKKLATSFSENNVKTTTPVYAYPETADNIGSYFSDVRIYGVESELQQNMFDYVEFSLDTIASKYNKNTFELRSVTCNGKPCELSKTGTYVCNNAGLDERIIEVTYSLGGSVYSLRPKYPAVAPDIQIWGTYDGCTQTSISGRVYAESDNYLKPSEQGVIAGGTKLVQAGNGENDRIKITGLYPENGYNLIPYAVYNGKTYYGAECLLRAKSLSPKMTTKSIGVTTFSCEGSWDKGDAVVLRWGWECDGKISWTNNTTLNVEGLKLNTTGKVRFCVQYNAKIYYSSYTYVTTKAISITTLPAECVSDRTARICATTNCDASKGGGFEWRRYDAPDLVPSTYSDCPIINGKMSGSLKNLNINTYYKYRPYYKDSDGTYYFGEWLAFGTADAYVYFEPDVYTSTYTIEDDIVWLKGFIVAGSDKIVRQGFEYWAVRDGGVQSPSFPSAVQVLLVADDAMDVALTDISPNTTYCYRAFATTEKGTTYGATSRFTSPDAVGISGPTDDNATPSVLTRADGNVIQLMVKGVAPDAVCHLTSLSGQTLWHGPANTGEWTSLPALAASVYVITVVDGQCVVSKKIVVK